MQIILDEAETMALIGLRKMLKEAATPVPQFLHWIADRLTKIHGDNEQVDFVQALRRRAEQIHDISNQLHIDRGPERLP